MFSGSQQHDFIRQYYYLFKSQSLIRRYIVLKFLQKNTLFLPTKYEIRRLVAHQNGAYSNFHWSVPTSMYYLPTNPYTSVADFLCVHCLVESALNSRVLAAIAPNKQTAMRSVGNKGPWLYGPLIKYSLLWASWFNNTLRKRKTDFMVFGITL